VKRVVPVFHYNVRVRCTAERPEHGMTVVNGMCESLCDEPREKRVPRTRDAGNLIRSRR